MRSPSPTPCYRLARFFVALGAATYFAQAMAHPGGSAHAAQETELIGTPPYEWQVEHWMNSPPLSLEALRGKVVLVRWWTAPHCPFCTASAPALNELDRLYREKGLVVVGVYHHKSPAPLDPKEVEAFAQNFGFRFPMAIDPGWQTLRRWWLDGRPRAFTSVSFLLDRDGIIRYIHPGGSYALGSSDFRELQAKIEELLALR